MCTVVFRLQPDEEVPLLLLGIRDEFTNRAWRPPARHWGGSPLIGGIDERAGGTWLAVHPGDPAGGPRMACLLNGRGRPAEPENRRSRGELPLRAAADGAGTGKDLAGDPVALAAYDPFYLVYADTAGATLLSWDGEAAVLSDLPPGTHLLTNAGHAYPAESITGSVTEPKAVHFGARFAASADPSRWLALADGDGLAADDPRAIVARRELPDGRIWGTTSQTLVALSPSGIRYDFRPVPGDWSRIPV
jgi:uncharacterized protein with NRDE domain